MTAHTMLRELGYTTSPSGISAFQRDFNRIGGRTLLVTGELDADTSEAVTVAYRSRAVFTTVRDQRGV